MRIRQLALVWLLALISASTAQAATNWSQTLVVLIGNSANEHAAALPYAANDLTAMQDYAERGLRAQQVQVFPNAGSNDFENIFDPGGLIDAELRGRNLLVYISGHGLVEPASGKNSFLPADANPARSKQLYAMDKVLAALERARIAQRSERQDRRVIALFDTCFSGQNRANPNEAAFEGRASGLPSQPVEIGADIAVLSASGGIAYDDDQAELGALTSGFLRAVAGLGDAPLFDGNQNRRLEGQELQHYLKLSLASLAGSGLNQRADLSGPSDFALPLYAVAQVQGLTRLQQAEALLKQAEDSLFYLPDPLDYEDLAALKQAQADLRRKLKPLRAYDRFCRRGAGCEGLAQRRELLKQRIDANRLGFEDQRAWVKHTAESDVNWCRGYLADCQRLKRSNAEYFCLYAAEAESRCSLLLSPAEEHDLALLDAAKASGARGDWLACAQTCKLAESREEAASQIVLIDQRQAELAKEQAELAKRKEEQRLAQLRKADREAWDGARKAGRIADYQAYLADCKAEACAYSYAAGQAIKRLEELEREQQRQEAERKEEERKQKETDRIAKLKAADTAAWNKVRTSTSVATLRRYIDTCNDVCAHKAEAANTIGNLYYYGTNVAKNYYQAVIWYRKAANQGHAMGQNNLGWVYEKGRGVGMDLKQAASWYRKAAAQGNNDAAGNLRRVEAALKSSSTQSSNKTGDTFRDCPTCPLMTVIPAGSFMMGSNDGDADEKPVHRVQIRQAFAMGVYEVTFDEWQACVRDGYCQANTRPDDNGWGRGRRPVIYVSWNDITAAGRQGFVSWLNSKVAGNPYRLPSEAEWEYAARAGSSTKYWWGKIPPSCLPGQRFTAAFRGSEVHKTCPGYGTKHVGFSSPNGYGLYDVHGNIWEWVQDCWNAYYSHARNTGAARADGDCTFRAFRGGYWNSPSRDLRSSSRHRGPKSLRTQSIGFRIARAL